MTHSLTAPAELTDGDRSRQAGFSILEGLIAAFLLLVITVGILPLFSRAMRNNVQGNDASRQANGAIDAFETAGKVPFNSAILAVPPGETSLVDDDFLALRRVNSPTGGTDQIMSTAWVPAASLGVDDEPRLHRRRTVQYFSFDDLLDDGVFNNPRDGGVEARLVHFKVVDVMIEDLTGPGRRPYVIRSVQAF